jgi:hypothetical protein
MSERVKTADQANMDFRVPKQRGEQSPTLPQQPDIMVDGIPLGRLFDLQISSLPLRNVAPSVIWAGATPDNCRAGGGGDDDDGGGGLDIPDPDTKWESDDCSVSKCPDKR